MVACVYILWYKHSGSCRALKKSEKHLSMPHVPVKLLSCPTTPIVFISQHIDMLGHFIFVVLWLDETLKQWEAISMLQYLMSVMCDACDISFSLTCLQHPVVSLWLGRSVWPLPTSSTLNKYMYMCVCIRTRA
jgi:hypothetical protein